MRRLPRDEAVALVRAEQVGGCLMCALAAREPQTIVSTPNLFSFVPRFGLRPGHVLVVIRRHVTRFSELPATVWAEAGAEAQRLAVLHEREPGVRCYVASLGTDDADVPMSSPHLHLHVVPLRERGAKPSEVLTWKHGVYEHDPAELAAQALALRPSPT